MFLQAPVFLRFTSGDRAAPETPRKGGDGHWQRAARAEPPCLQLPELAAGAAGWCSVTEKISKGWWLGGTQEEKKKKEERLIDEKTSQLVQPAPKPQESISYWASPPVPMATQFGAL